MSFQSRLRPSSQSACARRRPKGKAARGTVAGGRDVQPYEVLEGRRLLSATYTLSGGADVNEGDYVLTLAVQGAAGSTISHWDVNWGDGSAVQSVNPAGAASVNLTHNFDGPAERRVTATATLTSAAVVQAESANHNGYLDTTFNAADNTPGKIPGTRVDALGLPKSVAVDADGNTIVAYQNSGAVRLKRFTPAGAPDLGWGNDALTHTAVVPFVGDSDDDELSLLISGTSVYVGGESTNGLGNTDFAVARFGLSTGTPDGGWGAGGVRVYDIGNANGNDSVNVLAAQGSSIIAAGNSAGSFAMIRLSTTGVLDTTFGSGGVASSVVTGWQAQDAVVLADGSIVTAGPQNTGNLVVQKFNAAGSSAWFNNGFTGSFDVLSSTSLGLRADGKIALASNKTVSGNVDIFLARLNADGSLDSTFNTFDTPGTFTYDGGGLDTVFKLVLQPDGTMVTLGGSEPAGTAEFAVHGFRDLGGSIVPDESFGQDFDDVINVGQRDPGEGTGHTNTAIGPISEIRAAAVTPGGSIVAAGYTDFSPNNRIALARYGGDLGVNVANVAPTVTGPSAGVPGQTIALSVAEPSAADRAAGYMGDIDWGDGTVDSFGGFDPDTFAFVGAPVPTHVYSTTGSFVVSANVFDKDGEANNAVFTINVTTTAVMSDPANPGKNMLLVGASDLPNAALNNNVISVSKSGTATRVVVDGAATNVSGVVDRVLVYGNAGNDDISVASSFNAPVELYGGAGDDRLRGGGGSDILVGGDGVDLLSGSNGRDLLIGEGAYHAGVGSVDLINGDQNDDILIGGYTDFVNRRDAMGAILAEWNSGRTYAERVHNLRDGTGTAARLNRNAATGEDFFLVANVTVFDDGVVDLLTGGNGQDWFFADVDGTLFVRDFITDLSNKEFADDLDFINAP